MPERPDVVELGDEVVVELATSGTERFLLADPVEALDQLRISVESPLAQILLGRRAGEQVDVGADWVRVACHSEPIGADDDAAHPLALPDGVFDDVLCLHALCVPESAAALVGLRSRQPRP
jgi:Transcription elongation factor, GreA/GreB, C-term